MVEERRAYEVGMPHGTTRRFNEGKWIDSGAIRRIGDNSGATETVSDILILNESRNWVGTVSVVPELRTPLPMPSDAQVLQGIYGSGVRATMKLNSTIQYVRCKRRFKPNDL